MLESGDLGGKCGNSLYVGLARAAGLPARDFFGIRVADSNVTKSLNWTRSGAGSGYYGFSEINCAAWRRAIAFY
jgi:transglutaminase-like putative cysteine protease